MKQFSSEKRFKSESDISGPKLNRKTTKKRKKESPCDLTRNLAQLKLHLHVRFSFAFWQCDLASENASIGL